MLLVEITFSEGVLYTEWIIEVPRWNCLEVILRFYKITSILIYVYFRIRHSGIHGKTNTNEEKPVFGDPENSWTEEIKRRRRTWWSHAQTNSE